MGLKHGHGWIVVLLTTKHNSVQGTWVKGSTKTKTKPIKSEGRGSSALGHGSHNIEYGSKVVS